VIRAVIDTNVLDAQSIRADISSKGDRRSARLPSMDKCSCPICRRAILASAAFAEAANPTVPRRFKPFRAQVPLKLISDIDLGFLRGLGLDIINARR
jgi:hypothetical protein